MPGLVACMPMLGDRCESKLWLTEEGTYFRSGADGAPVIWAEIAGTAKRRDGLHGLDRASSAAMNRKCVERRPGQPVEQRHECVRGLDGFVRGVRDDAVKHAGM